MSITGMVMILAASGAQAEAPAPLVPTDAWSISFGEGMCVLARPFGVKGNEVTFGFRRLPLDAETTILVMRPAAGDKLFRDGKATLTFLPSATAIESNYRSTAVADGVKRLATFTVAQSAMIDFPTSTAVEVDLGAEGRMRFALSTTAAGLRALRECDQAVLKQWGIDPTETDAIAASAVLKGSVVDWFGIDAYPDKARRADKQGTTAMLWEINATGRASNCRVIVSSGTPMLDEASCARVLQYGRYRPAMGKDGKPVKSHATMRVRWVLPK